MDRTFFGGAEPIGGVRPYWVLGLLWGSPHEQHAPTGIVLGTIFVGGSLMAGAQLSPGDLMSFLVASQTVQRSVSPSHVTPPHHSSIIPSVLPPHCTSS